MAIHSIYTERTVVGRLGSFRKLSKGIGIVALGP